jgi:ATP-dependent helicase/nuclease subunit A
MKGRFADEEAAFEAARPGHRARTAFQRPRFAAEEFGLTAAQRGTALHLAMQHLALEHTGSRQEIARQIDAMVRRELLTSQQAEAVDPGRLAAFFASELGREVKQAALLRREFRFSLLVPAAEYYPGVPGEETLLLQGVIDCCFETAQGRTVIDFKTDRVTERTAAERAREYRPQMAAYSRALETITGKPVIRRILWFFSLDDAVEI